MGEDKAAEFGLIDNPEAPGIHRTKMDRRKTTQWKQWMAGITATLSMTSVGTVYGWYTTCVSRLQNEEAKNLVPVPLTPSEASWLLSLTGVGSMIGPFIGAAMADNIGRKRTLLISSLTFIIGWIMIIFGKDVPTYYVSRLILGIGVGISYTTNPMYVSEIADVNIRGALGTLIATNVFTGSLFACLIGPHVSIEHLTVILLAIPLLFLVTFIWFPESPYYLVAKGRKDEAMKAIGFLKGIHNEEELQEELDVIIKNINENIDTQNFKDKILELRLPNNLRALLIIIGLITAQQLSGNFVTASYLEELFKSGNPTSGHGLKAHDATSIVFAVSLVSCAIATSTVEKAGRRPLLFVSTLGTTTTLAIFATYRLLGDKNYADVSNFTWIPILDVTVFQIMYLVGLGTLTNALIGELFPTNVKAIAGATITVTDGILGLVITKLYQPLEERYGTFSIYYFFACSCLLAFFFVYFFVPETKNKTFTEIQTDLTESRNNCFRRRKLPK